MKKLYYVSICNLLLRAQGIPELYFFRWFACSVVISSSQWNVSVVSIFGYLRKCDVDSWNTWIFGGHTKIKVARSSLLLMWNVSKHVNMQSWYWLDSLLVEMLNYNNIGSWFKSIYNLRKNIWNRVSKSSKM